MTKISDAEPGPERPRTETYFDDEGGMFFVNGNFLEYFDVFRHRWRVIAHRPIKLLPVNPALGRTRTHTPRLTKRPQRGASLLRLKEETPAIGG